MSRAAAFIQMRPREGNLSNDDIAQERASVPGNSANGDGAPCPNQGNTEDQAFWQGIVALAIQFVCHVERHKLHCTYTTSDLRRAGKSALCGDHKS